MKMPWTATRLVFVVILAALFAGTAPFAAQVQAQSELETDVLARVEVTGPVQNIGLPVYAHIRDAAGNDYVLVIAPLKQITGSGFSCRILDDPASPGKYYLALERRKGARDAAAGLFAILHDDGRRILVKGSPEVAEKLSGLGFGVKAIPGKPIILRKPVDINATSAQSISSSPQQLTKAQTSALIYADNVAAMIDQVQESLLYEEVGNLSGENAVTIGGSPYTIATRNSNSGTPILMATQYVYECMAAMGLVVSYHDWSIPPYSNRNVVGTKTGVTKPAEIVLVTAHLDDVPSSGPAPGADDNASGSAALLIMAEIMASGTFERTLRFVFFTGEEQGLFGSSAYADASYSAGENIVAVYNMDMISWDSVGGPTLRLHTRISSNPGYNADMAIATIFSDVVATYGLSSMLTPIITSDGEAASDHSTFWDNGYAAIMAIEDDYDDFTPYYHTANDNRDSLNMTYFTNYTKASLGAVAHLALAEDVPPSSDGGGGGGGGCFIATAAFGSPMAGQVEILQQFRDRYLLTNNPGRMFVDWYYRNGPAAANYIKDKPLAKAAVRVFLYPLIGFSFLLLTGYLPFVMIGLLLSAFLFFRLRRKTSSPV